MMLFFNNTRCFRQGIRVTSKELLDNRTFIWVNIGHSQCFFISAYDRFCTHHFSKDNKANKTHPERPLFWTHFFPHEKNLVRSVWQRGKRQNGILEFWPIKLH